MQHFNSAFESTRDADPPPRGRRRLETWHEVNPNARAPSAALHPASTRPVAFNQEALETEAAESLWIPPLTGASLTPSTREWFSRPRSLAHRLGHRHPSLLGALQWENALERLAHPKRSKLVGEGDVHGWPHGLVEVGDALP